MATALASKKCEACEGGGKALAPGRIAKLLKEVSGWAVANGELRKTFKFKNYYESMAFVNATAWISHQENHHPDMEVGYNRVTMRYSTHSVGGLTENDFICAAKVEALTPA